MIFSSPLPPRSARRAFTLVELLVVMAIIAIVIALVIPAIGRSRKSVQASETKSLLTQLSNATSTFMNDERRTPGFFSEKEMGSLENETTRGMSEMENIMLDLYGYQPPTTSTTITVNVGPTVAHMLPIDAQLIGVPGSGSKQYFVPNKKQYVIMTPAAQQVGTAPHTAVDTDPNQLSDVADTWRVPILAWRQDDTFAVRPTVASVGNGTSGTYKFGAADSGTKAKYYWASNACFLKADRAGKYGSLNQAADSLIGTSANGAASLSGILGNPSDPFRDPSNLAATPIVARSSRAPIVYQSAGIDGIYLGKKDPGGKFFNGGAITYSTNFIIPGTTTGYVDRDGRPTNHDLLGDFDDIFSQAGN